jgi:hypothetical protein
MPSGVTHVVSQNNGLTEWGKQPYIDLAKKYPDKRMKPVQAK